MKIILDPSEMPQDLPVMIGGVLSIVHSDAWAWAGNGKSKIKIPVQVIVEHPALDEIAQAGPEE